VVGLPARAKSSHGRCGSTTNQSETECLVNPEETVTLTTKGIAHKIARCREPAMMRIRWASLLSAACTIGKPTSISALKSDELPAVESAGRTLGFACDDTSADLTIALYCAENKCDPSKAYNQISFSTASGSYQNSAISSSDSAGLSTYLSQVVHFANPATLVSIEVLIPLSASTVQVASMHPKHKLANVWSVQLDPTTMSPD